MMKKYIAILIFLLSFNVYSAKKIQFEIINNQIYLTVEINKKSSVLLYDTGAFGFTLDSTFVKRNNLINGLKKSTIDLKINQFQTTIIGFNILDYRKYSKHSFDGIIGIDFFKDYILEIDYLHSQLILYEEKERLYTEYKQVTSVHNLNSFSLYGMFFIPINIRISEDSILEGNYLLDTGSSRNITLIDKNYINKFNDNKVKIIRNKSSFYGFNESIMIKSKKIELDTIKFRDIIIDFSENKSSDFKKNNLKGIVGGGFLRQFNIVIDYKKSKIFLMKNKTGNDNRIITDGFTLSDERKNKNKIIVSSVFRSNFHSEDIEIDDEILEINNVLLEKIDFKLIEKQKTTIGEKIKYKIKRGSKIFEIHPEVKCIL